MQAMPNEEQEAYGYLLSSNRKDDKDPKEIMRLLKLYNKDLKKLKGHELEFVRSNLINAARQLLIDLSFYTDGQKLYIGPKYLKSPEEFDKYGMSKSLTQLALFVTTVADAERVFSLSKKEIEVPQGVLEKAKYFNFQEVYMAELNNGNKEYIYYHPQYKAVVHFEIKPDGTNAQIYSLDKEPGVLIPIEYGPDQKTVVKYCKFNDNILGTLESSKITKWPEIKIGEGHYFTSTEDREYLDQTQEFVDDYRKQRFFSIRTLQKIALSKELIALMGFNNAAQIDQMSKAGLTQDIAFELSKSDLKNLD